MPSNFDFLRSTWPGLVDDAVAAERLGQASPRACALQCRFVLESAVVAMYARDPTLGRPYEGRLGAMIHEAAFRTAMPTDLFPKVKAVYLLGNQAAHRAQSIGARDGVRVVEEMFHFLYWLSRTYSADANSHPEVHFDPSRIPAATPAELSPDRLRAIEQDLEARAVAAARRYAAEEKARTEAEVSRLKAELEALKAKNARVPDPHDYNEAQTRDLFIDRLLREAGWPLDRPGHDTELPVTGMPGPTGQGFVDYVLWGDDGFPLGIVEAKATRHSPQKGKQQATLYADCLEKRYGLRPVLFLSNGYEHWLWDDAAGPPRAVAGFFTRDELALLHRRRATASSAATVPIDPAIVDRPYQHEAIRRVCEHLEQGHRRALVVMATGTGKTRMVIALVDVLLKAGQVRRVLFLADRTGLLTQARRAFKRHLPRCAAVDLLRDPDGDGSVYLSTYPTLVNLVDRLDGGRRKFGPGFFDLVITDEVHRSVYKKFGALFSWFDCCLVGLTATPRGDVHRDTFRLFELEKGVPTFAYELDEAVRDGYLVPPKARPVPFRFLRHGIRYSDLSEEEREEYEEKFTDDETGSLRDHIQAREINDWVFNQDTVDKALDYLLSHGLKVEGGSRLGKTIVFARNHRHAEYIVERFDKKWPALKGTFARVIDSHDDYAQTLLDEFARRASPPHIAVSVDMLDTGVDIPEVVTLVFFRAVSSKTKFHQMIGRGTRLCPGLLGGGVDKDHFLVLDLCGNLEFFEQALPEEEARLPEGLGERLLKQRARLLMLLPAEEAELREGLLDRMHAHVAGMDLDHFEVRAKRAEVEALRERSAWTRLDADGIQRAVLAMAVLPTADGAGEDAGARQFDVLALRLQIGLLAPDRGFEEAQEQLRRLACNLLDKAARLPMVAQYRALLESIALDPFWEGLTVRRMESTRLALREIVRFADRQPRDVEVVDFEDELMAGAAADAAIPRVNAGIDVARYRRKVEAFIRGHLDHLAVSKLRHNRPLTPTDLESLETVLCSSEVAVSKEHLDGVLEGEPLTVFVRRLVGLDRDAVKVAFAGWLASGTPTSSQIRFVGLILEYLTRNGVMDPARLYEPPFTGEHPDGLDGVFDEPTGDRLISIIREVNQQAGYREPARAAGGR